jgi:hypothetical protein
VSDCDIKDIHVQCENGDELEMLTCTVHTLSLQPATVFARIK